MRRVRRTVFASKTVFTSKTAGLDLMIGCSSWARVFNRSTVKLSTATATQLVVLLALVSHAADAHGLLTKESMDLLRRHRLHVAVQIQPIEAP